MYETNRILPDSKRFIPLAPWQTTASFFVLDGRGRASI
jgi:hypothetical protein